MHAHHGGGVRRRPPRPLPSVRFVCLASGAVRYCGQRMRLRDHFTTFSGVAKQIDTSPVLIPTTVTPTPVGTGGEPLSEEVFGPDPISVQAGGAKIDDGGFTINAIAAPLLHDPSLGSTLDGGLTKLGSGKLTLAANNT